MAKDEKTSLALLRELVDKQMAEIDRLQVEIARLRHLESKIDELNAAVRTLRR